MGRTALISHARGKKHTSRVVLSAKVKKEQHTLAAFWHPETEQSDGQEASTSYAPMASATSIEQQRANKLNTETAVKEYQGTHLPLPEHRQAGSTYYTNGVSSFVSRDSVLTAEIMWAIKSVMNHYSCSSSTHTQTIFFSVCALIVKLPKNLHVDKQSASTSFVLGWHHTLRRKYWIW